MDLATKRYLGAWAGAAVAALAALLLSSDLDGFDLATAATMVALITAAELIVVHVDLGRSGAVFTLTEAAITAGLLLVDPVHVVLGAFVAMSLAHLPRHLSAEKLTFNLSQITVATSVAGLVMLATPDLGPAVGERALSTVVLAMVAYAAVNTVAFRGLVARIAGRDGVADFDEQAPLTLASSFGTVAVGVVAASLWTSQPLLIPLLLVPVLAIQVAARSSLAAASLVGTLRAERDRLDQVVQGASEGILLLDSDATIRVWSPALEDLTGISTSEVIGTPVSEVLTDERRIADHPVRDRWLIDTADAEQHRQRLQTRWRSGDGELHDIQEDHALVFDERGHCLGDVVLVRDVSRETELERLRADFVASISHELRSPLTPIRGYIQLLLRRGHRMTETQRHEALTSVLERADHLGEIVEDLLLVTQVERGQLQGVVEPEPIPVSECLVQVVEEATEREPHRIIDLTLEPSTSHAWADPPRLRQAVAALVDNALRYSPVDEPVTVEFEQDSDDVCIRVTDHGRGIPRAQHERIFDRFQRSEDPLTMETSGVGLGLFLARRLTEAMGGTLELESSVPGRSVFALRLRAATPEETAEYRPGKDRLAGPRNDT